MKLQIGIIIAFALLVNIYTFIRNRKSRKKDTNTSAGYHRPECTHYTLKNDNREELPSNYKKQITKYNSSLDYIEKK